MACVAFLLWDIARHYFPRAGPGSGGHGIAGHFPCHLRPDPDPQSADLRTRDCPCQFHDSLALLASYLAYDHRRRLPWLAAAGIERGLGCWCARPVMSASLWSRPSSSGARFVRARAIALASLWRLAGCLAPLRDRRGRHRSTGSAGRAVRWVATAMTWSTLPSYAATVPVFAISCNFWHYLLGLAAPVGWFPFSEGNADGPFSAQRVITRSCRFTGPPMPRPSCCAGSPSSPSKILPLFTASFRQSAVVVCRVQPGLCWS